MDAGELEGWIESLYGKVDWQNAVGLLQVVAIDEATGAVLAIGPTFETDEAIAALFSNPCSRTTVREPSGHWHFERYRR